MIFHKCKYYQSLSDFKLSITTYSFQDKYKFHYDAILACHCSLHRAPGFVSNSRNIFSFSPSPCLSGFPSPKPFMLLSPCSFAWISNVSFTAPVRSFCSHLHNWVGWQACVTLGPESLSLPVTIPLLYYGHLHSSTDHSRAGATAHSPLNLLHNFYTWKILNTHVWMTLCSQ